MYSFTTAFRLKARLHALLYALLLWCSLASPIRAVDPVSTAWFVNPTNAQQPASLARIRPEVHSVTTTDRHMEIRSAGLSLHDLGALQSPPDHIERMRQLRFRIPRFPAPVTTHHLSVRPDAVGAFLNGVPIYNQFEAQSYQGQNLWHFDPLARNGGGAHQLQLGLLAQLIADSSRHSPLLGYAFDGYPIYGPWGFVSGKESGGLRRMRSGYRVRNLIRRDRWANGTALTPAQHGPPINDEYPLGTFVEDYEYDTCIGDLDEFNGRFALTPEYPQGTYAYFLTTDEYGRLAFPYLLAERYYGEVKEDELRAAFVDEADPTLVGRVSNPPYKGKALASFKDEQLELNLSGNRLAANQPLALSFTARANNGTALRHLEFVHERPLHLLVVSEDLGEFAHLHPTLTAGDHYEVVHSFAHGGRWRLYADFTPPGGAQRIERFSFTLPGKIPVAELKPDKSVKQGSNLPGWFAKEQAGLTLSLTPQQPLRAGEDIELAFTIRDAKTGQPINDHEPYLGAWAHFVVLDQKHENFLHAHPLEAVGQVESLPHTHAAANLGPPPDTIRTLVNFPRPGFYKLWAQFQRNGIVITQPFVLQVAIAQVSAKVQAVTIPPNAPRLELNAQGYAPARLMLPANHPITLAITTRQRPACANRIHFASLGLTRDLPVNGTVLLALPALPTGEISFSCGMGMYRGSLVVQ
jgi:hypothetical protein